MTDDQFKDEMITHNTVIFSLKTFSRAAVTCGSQYLSVIKSK